MPLPLPRLTPASIPPKPRPCSSALAPDDGPKPDQDHDPAEPDILRPGLCSSAPAPQECSSHPTPPENPSTSSQPASSSPAHPEVPSPPFLPLTADLPHFTIMTYNVHGIRSVEEMSAILTAICSLQARPQLIGLQEFHYRGRHKSLDSQAGR